MGVNQVSKALDEARSNLRMLERSKSVTRDELVAAVFAVYQQEQADIAYDLAMSEAMHSDPTGQDLDYFLNFEG